MIRVSLLVADSDLRARLRELAASPRIDVDAHAEALADSWTEGVDVIVVDGQATLPADLGDVPGVVVVGESPAAARLAQQTGAPAWGVVPAAVDRLQLQAAIEAVAAGLVVVPVGLTPAATGSAAEPAPDDDALDVEPLTPRELDVLTLATEGLPNRAIARELGISEHTVKFHLAAIYGKLGVSTRTEAVRRALRRGLIDL